MFLKCVNDLKLCGHTTDSSWVLSVGVRQSKQICSPLGSASLVSLLLDCFYVFLVKGFNTSYCSIPFPFAVSLPLPRGVPHGDV